ncbi:MAG: hypothetical protein ACK4HQ_03860 [Brevinematales bacterium]
MPKMKISGQTQGRLVFAYDIREGHINYQTLLPALNKLLAKMGYKQEATPKDLEEIIGEILYQTNEKVFMNLEQLFTEGKFTHSNIEELLIEAIKTVMKEKE